MLLILEPLNSSIFVLPHPIFAFGLISKIKEMCRHLYSTCQNHDLTDYLDLLLLFAHLVHC